VSIAKIIGVGEFLPGDPVTNEKMEKVFGLRADWVDLAIGTRTRHFAVDLESKQVRFRLADLCERAARGALESAGAAAEDIDAIVLSSATPDHLMPATVNVVAERLGIDQVATFEIQSGCAGAIQAVLVAKALLETGAFRTVMTISGDTSYKFIDFSRDFSKLPPSELINFALFGDGAGAAVLTTSPRVRGIRVDHAVNRFEGKGRKPGHLLHWYVPGGAAPEATHDGAASASEDYKAIESNVPVMARELLEELLGMMGRTREDVSFFLPPQLGGKISGSIIRGLELSPDRCINRVAEVGNTGNATPYFQLTELHRRMRSGDTAIALAIESSKWIKTGLALGRE
jgi:3-oxoacyl-[acyl-carrier-protein] synthase-3